MVRKRTTQGFVVAEAETEIEVRVGEVTDSETFQLAVESFPEVVEVLEPEPAPVAETPAVVTPSSAPPVVVTLAPKRLRPRNVPRFTRVQ